MRNGTLAVIPARLGSERLARKPLHPIAGKPLLEWVWRRVTSFESLDRVLVATDAAEIAQQCEKWGAECVLTSVDHESGTSRIAEVAARPDCVGYEVIVNVQGDEPFIEEEQVVEAVAQVRRGFDIGTVAAPVGTLAAWRDSGVVKVTRRADGAALYFSRSPIPFLRDGEPTEAELSGPPYLRHIGLYAYAPSVLHRWSSLPASELERIEKLEQLRALEAGLTIGVGVVRMTEGGVDTLADAERAEQRLMATESAGNSVR